MTSLDSKRVFISYSHDSPEHKDWVLALAGRLRADGIDARLDRYVTSPEEGWPRWMQSQIEDSDFTIVVCTEIYKRRFEGRESSVFGSGVTWEGLVANQLLYDNGSRNRRFIAAVPPKGEISSIPIALRGFTYYLLDESYDSLVRHIKNEPEVIAPPLGEKAMLPSQSSIEIERQLVLSDGVPAEKPVLMSAITQGPNGDTCFQMDLFSPFNCQVFHSGVICTKYGPEAPTWNVRVADQEQLLNEDGEVRALQPFVVLVESTTNEPITLVARTNLWLRYAVPSGTRLRVKQRLGVLLIPKDNVIHPPFTISRGVTYEGILKYRPRIIDRFWRTIGSTNRRDKFEITGHHLVQDSGVAVVSAPLAGIFIPTNDFHYTPGQLVKTNQRIGFINGVINQANFLRDIRSSRTGTLLSTLIAVNEAVYAGQPLFRIRTDPPTLNLTMMPSQANRPYWYDLFAPLHGTFNLESVAADGRLLSSGTKFARGVPLCTIETGDIVARIGLDFEGSVMQIFARKSQPVSFGELLMTVKAESVLIRAPIVGNFFRARGPGQKPFVSVGSKVQEGDVLCLIEALKLNSEIQSELPGVITEILAENGSSLEYGEPLFVIKPD